MLNIVRSMDETPMRRIQFANALLSYDPQFQRYQDPRKYDFHFSGAGVSQAWKARMSKELRELADYVIEKVLTKRDMIVLFDRENLVGNVIFVPLEGDMPQDVVDPIVFNKYIKWAPPANIISAIVPSGFRLDIKFQDGSVKSASNGVVRSIIISQPIQGISITRAL